MQERGSDLGDGGLGQKYLDACSVLITFQFLVDSQVLILYLTWMLHYSLVCIKHILKIKVNFKKKRKKDCIQRRLLGSPSTIGVILLRKEDRYRAGENRRSITSLTATVQRSYQFINPVTKEKQVQVSLSDPTIASNDYFVPFLSMYRSFLYLPILVRFHFVSSTIKLPR